MKSIVFLYFMSLSAFLYGQSQDIYLIIGQSNMAGRAPIPLADTTQLSTVLILNELGLFVPAKNPLNIFSTIRKTDPGIQRLGPAYSFSHYLSNYTGDTVRIIVQARGGTPIECFLKGGNWGYYEATLNRVMNAKKKYPNLRVRAVLIHQGESNRHNPEMYIEMFRKLATDLRTDLESPDLPIIYGEVGYWNKSYQGIRDIMRQLPDSIPYTYKVSAEGLTNFDDHHFDTPSALELGRRYAEMCIRIFELKSYKLKGNR